MNMSESDDGTDSLCRSASAPTTPTESPKIMCMARARKGHRVNFPEDSQIVTGYFEAPSPWGYVYATESLVESYKVACEKQCLKPIVRILRQLENFNSNELRQYDLSLKGEKLDYKHCEALEEIFKRIQFRLIDLESCDLDGEGASALFDMMEYYDSSTHLSISNVRSLGMLGWQALCRMLKKTMCLQYLDLSNTGLNEQILLILGRAIRLGSQLVTLHLENAGLYGRRLAILVAALKLNTNLKNLYLGDNKITSADGVQIGNLLRSNSCLELLDLRRNHLQDLGLDHICEGLSHQVYNHGEGLRVLNISENQISCRGIHRLSETLPSSTSLKSLNMHSNYLGNDGIVILKTGLLSSNLKYLNLRNTQITSEGAISIAEYIKDNTKIAAIDLSENDIKTVGLHALSMAVKQNSSIFELNLSENLFEQNDFESDENNATGLLKEIKECYKRNKSGNIETSKEDFVDECSCYYNYLGKSNLQIPSLSGSQVDNQEEFEFVQSNSLDKQDSSLRIISVQKSHKPDVILDQESQHKQIMRSTSLGSWENQISKNTKKSGRFSVSPVNLSTETASEVLKFQEASPSIDISSNIPTNEITIPFNGHKLDFAQNLENEKTDELTELPKNIPKKLSLLVPDTSLPSRRMSTPSLSMTSSSKPKPATKPKIERNLDSLDLKSSLPISPTFFARFEFPDPVLLKLPPEVEDVIVQLMETSHHKDFD